MTTAHETSLVPTVATGAPGERLPVVASGADSFGWWGMWGLIATEAMLFGSLLASYFYLRFQAGPGGWPPDGIHRPDLVLPLLMSAILWSSSLPVHVADRGIRRGSQRLLRMGLLGGFLLGAAFLGMQLLIEYPKILKEFHPSDNAYGSMFFTITGFHGFHVAVGLLLSLWTQMRAWMGAFDEHRHLTVQNFAMYWHFVDIVWLLVAFTVYVSPHL